MTLIIPLLESAGDPTAVANNTILYAKDVAGVTQAFFRASDGSLTQISGVPTGTFLNRQIFTSNGTYTPTAGTRMVRVRMVGGGGGGGGAGGGGSARCGGGGGSSGVYWERFFDPGASITGGAVTIGTAGAGGASTGGTGGNGGDTTVVIQGTTYTAKGGTGNEGLATAGDAYTYAVNPQAGSSVADFTSGEPGEPGMAQTGGTLVVAGSGGSNPFGSGGATLTDSDGTPGSGFGAGGGGGLHNGTTDRAGGAGSAGLVIIDEYAQGAIPAGLFLGRQIFTANGTYTPTLTAKRVRVRMVGGGGGGGGGGGAGGPISGGGAGGAYFELTISPGALITGGAVTIGAAGAGGSSGTGGTGGDTSVVVQGVTYTAKGGLGGLLNSNVGDKIAAGGATQAGTSSGDVTFQCAGKWGITNGSYNYGGDGGDSALGAGGQSTASDTGNNGQGYGGGGSGAVDNGFGSVGGNGTAGLVIIEEYTA